MGPALTQASDVHFTWDELIRAAITVGRRNWSDVLQHGTYSVLEMLWRVALVRSNLVEEPDGRLGQSNAFIALDPSEKSAVSYFLGLVFTKLIADKLFGVPWLLHLDVYKKEVNPYLALTVRPDFVGMDANLQWLVAESKARTRFIDRKALQEAKRQTRSLRHLNGQLPALRIAVGTYFSSQMIRAQIWDPDDFDRGAVDLPIAPEQLAREYYRPVIEVVEESPRIETQVGFDAEGARRIALPGLDMAIGLDEDIIAWYHGDESLWPRVLAARQTGPSVLEQIGELRRISASERRAVQSDRTRREPIDHRRLREVSQRGLDGVAVDLGPSWNEQFMKRQPEDRGL
jgi:hypothetical protein